METIQMYLNNMFQHLPQIPKVLRAKEELYNMTEDKYHVYAGIYSICNAVITDKNNH